ncbi:YobH family protein [Rosenbergiella collisarenosi]|uniref:YobH family protein n=1 Tax=Rosenbergiella collisarenosi TaxID=1544695 RepID=UPI001BD9BE49|nr:YobH family protein [Rosenbergiella collisarenosi]MBT0722356.1 hypothetical protein [Rosenbergiella collisarenosi]
MGNNQNMLTRLLLVLLTGWGIMFVSDYGILTNREASETGFNLRCEYLTGKGLINADYLYSSETAHERCPLLKKTSDRIEM